MRKLVPSFIGICLLLSITFALHTAKDLTSYGGFTNESAKALVEKTQQQASSQYVKRDERRNQLMGLTATVLAGIIGLTLGKDKSKTKSDRVVLWVVAILFCLFMHGIDTMLADLSYKQVVYSNNLNSYLLKWDSLTEDGIKAALQKVADGNEPNDGFRDQKGCVRKASIFFWDGFSFMFLRWWGLTYIFTGLLLWDIKKK